LSGGSSGAKLLRDVEDKIEEIWQLLDLVDNCGEGDSITYNGYVKEKSA
jgi:hypothetical protein